MALLDIRSASSLAGKRVLLRTGLNVPLSGEKVTSDFRLRKALPTLKFLKAQGARVIVAAHIGSGEGGTLRPVSEELSKHVELSFLPATDEATIRMRVEMLGNGEVLLLENLRAHEGEKKNDEAFSRFLASLADMYVNDAFADSHRVHSSIVGVPCFLPSYAGLQLLEEIRELESALMPPENSLFILGGAKFGTKAPLIKKLLAAYGHGFVGGAHANDLFLARGLEVGRSLVATSKPDFSDVLYHERVMLPLDVTVEREGKSRIVAPHEVGPEDIIKDAGPKTIDELGKLIDTASFVLWNGPLGAFEGGYIEPTLALARRIAGSDAKSIVGGGDTVASISSLHLEERFSFISTGGGAMLEFLLAGTLPGIEALKNSAA